LYPRFICVGAQKAGTRWIYDQCSQHPKAWMPPIKEIQFLDGHIRFLRRFAAKKLERRQALSDMSADITFLQRAVNLPNKPSMSHYVDLFEPAGERVTGDISPSYANLDAQAAADIAKALPDCKFLYVVRNPIDRLWSQINMRVRKEREPEIVLSDLAAFRNVIAKTAITKLSFQSHTIERWMTAADGRFRVFLFDDLVVDPDGYRRDLFQYIGLDPTSSRAQSNYNRKASEKSVPLPPAFRDALVDYFGDEFDKLKRLIGNRARLPQWLQPVNDHANVA
jgi:hypothetical protein